MTEFIRNHTPIPLPVDTGSTLLQSEKKRPIPSFHPEIDITTSDWHAMHAVCEAVFADPVADSLEIAPIFTLAKFFAPTSDAVALSPDIYTRLRTDLDRSTVGGHEYYTDLAHMTLLFPQYLQPEKLNQAQLATTITIAADEEIKDRGSKSIIAHARARFQAAILCPGGSERDLHITALDKDIVHMSLNPFPLMFESQQKALIHASFRMAGTTPSETSPLPPQFWQQAKSTLEAYRQGKQWQAFATHAFFLSIIAAQTIRIDAQGLNVTPATQDNQVTALPQIKKF